MSEALLQVDNLQVSLAGVQAVRGVSFTINAGECLAMVGESGCGKSVTAMSLMGLLPASAQVRAETLAFAGDNLLAMGEAQWRAVRGNRIAMIFQNPMAALNPTMRIGEQIAEVLRLHRGMSAKVAKREAIELLQRMAIARAPQRARQYPFEFSGGMLQRVMIAMALACDPQLLIADEPTTALDVTVQAEVLSLLDELRRERGLALLLITHDLGVVARMADRVAVMYAGQLVEQGDSESLFYRTAHPYTQALKSAVPALSESGELPAIVGTPPDLRHPPEGCAFLARCEYAMRVCRQMPPPFFTAASHQAHCWRCHPDFKESRHD